MFTRKELQLARGHQYGFQYIWASGFNSDVDRRSTPEAVWDKGGSYTFPSSAGQITVASSSNIDSSSGSGGRTLYIQGLDSNYDPITETITLNGTSNVTTTQEFFRVNFAYLVTTGSSGYNAGVIEGTLGGDTVVYIPAEKSRSCIAVLSIPRNHKYLLYNMAFTLDRQANASVNVELYMYNEYGTRFYVDTVQVHSHNSPVTIMYNTPIIVPGKTDMLPVISECTDNNSKVGVAWSGYCVDLRKIG